MNTELRNEKSQLEDRNAFSVLEAERKVLEPVKKRAPWLCNNLSWERAVGVGLSFCGKDDN